MNKRKKLGKVISIVSRIMLVTILTLLTLTILNPRADAAGSCSHQNCIVRDVTLASCTKTGLRVTYCKDCGTMIKRETTAKLGHDLTRTVVNPTCTAAGYAETTCSRCSYYKKDETEALGHKYGDWKKTKEPTCTADGEQERRCTRCDAKQTAPIAKGHNFEIIPHPATCTTDKYSESKCTRCGFVRETFYDEGSALGHSEGAWETKQEATCTKDGLEVIYCKNCGTVLNSRPIPAGHKLETIIHPATCTTDRYAERKCTRCGVVTETVYDEGTALGHKYGAWKRTKEPTCIKPGTQMRSCTRCKAIQPELIPKLDHDLTRTVVNPTCTAAGYAETTCSGCSYYRKDEIEALGHDYDCRGICSRCGYQSSSNYKTKQEALEALCMELSESSISNPATAEMVISGEYLSKVSSFDFSSSFMPFGPNHFEFKPSEGYLEDSLLDGRGSFIYQYIIHPVESYPSNSGQIVLLDPRTNKLYHTSQYAWDVMVVEISADFPSEDKDEVYVQFNMMHQFRIVYTPTAMTARGTTTGFVSVEKTLYSISPGMQIGFDKNSDYYIAMLRKAETIKGIEFTRVAADIANAGFACLHFYQKDWVGFSQDVFNIVNETFKDNKNWEAETKTGEIYFKGDAEDQGYEAGVPRIVVETKPEQQLRRAGDSVKWLVKIGCKNNPSGPDLPHQLRIIIYFRTNFPGV